MDIILFFGGGGLLLYIVGNLLSVIFRVFLESRRRSGGRLQKEMKMTFLTGTKQEGIHNTLKCIPTLLFSDSVLFHPDQWQVKWAREAMLLHCGRDGVYVRHGVCDIRIGIIKRVVPPEKIQVFLNGDEDEFFRE